MVLFSTRNLSKWISVSLLAFSLGSGTESMAQSVIFPQIKQAGVAMASDENHVYELSNQLLKATFVEENGVLKFGGCEAMNLLPGSEVFKIKLADGKEVLASQMTLNKVEVKNLEGHAEATKGSERFDGKEIVAEYTYGNLNITWHAILRNGSHYLRTKLDIHAVKDVEMSEITPMIYSVDNIKAGTSLGTVGNTRGAVLASDKIFAGLETPMGLNRVNSNADISAFSYDSWNDRSFKWQPAEQTPKGILKLGFSDSDILGTRGYLTFLEGGRTMIRFNYATGNNRLNIVGVDVVDLNNKIVSSDYHIGHTGLSNDKNNYMVTIPKKGNYMLRYFIEIRTEKVESIGSITISRKVQKPVVIYDLLPGQTSKQYVSEIKLEKDSRKLSADQIDANETLTDGWKASDWKVLEKVPSRINELGFEAPQVKFMERPLEIKCNSGELFVEFNYATGYHRQNLVGVDLLDEEGNTVAYDYHVGFAGLNTFKNIYSMCVPYDGKFKLRYLSEEKTESIDASGNINITLQKVDTLHLPILAVSPLEGVWRRNTTLQAGKTWNVSSVVGLIAPGQQRRSFLSYIERERAVPWRAFPTYISWFELNIFRNDDPSYTYNMNVKQCEDVIKQWKTHLYDRYHTNIQSFVWDDGWDQYGTWTFNKNFPNGFKEPDELAKSMNTGIGAWLGPVGGYGKSGTYRRDYWKDKGGMQLSNPRYYKVFHDACENLTTKYDFRFFKFDGISQQWSSVGPDAGIAGEENAEGIISAELEIRRIKPDIFFNTTVGTWASPFWFHVSDAIWRQENDYGTVGNQGSERERWITYRDRLVYQNYVKNSPLCPINCLMTHGFILSKHGGAYQDMDYRGILNELKCAFACGSGMVELYADYALLNTIRGGQLWGEIAKCIKWQKKNEEVLPDVHWIGGNPWNGQTVEVYGWAAWNGKNACFTLRNGAGYAQTYKTTLREALDIPSYIKTTVTFENAFIQNKLSGFPTDTPIDIDEELTIRVPAFSVYVFDGVDNNISTDVSNVVVDNNQGDSSIYDISGRKLSVEQKGINIINGKKYYIK